MSTSRNKQRASQYIRVARARAEDHLSGARDPALDTTYDDQIRLMVTELNEMETALTSSIRFTYTPWISHAITDSWPFNSVLGDALLAACIEFKECMHHS